MLEIEWLPAFHMKRFCCNHRQTGLEHLILKRIVQALSLSDRDFIIWIVSALVLSSGRSIERNMVMWTTRWCTVSRSLKILLNSVQVTGCVESYLARVRKVDLINNPSWIEVAHTTLNNRMYLYISRERMTLVNRNGRSRVLATFERVFLFVEENRCRFCFDSSSILDISIPK